jgi:hypothetical protein
MLARRGTLLGEVCERVWYAEADAEDAQDAQDAEDAEDWACGLVWRACGLM